VAFRRCIRQSVESIAPYSPIYVPYVPVRTRNQSYGLFFTFLREVFSIKKRAPHFFLRVSS
jgi:hypothetical protein